MNMKTLPIIAAILLYPVALNAIPNVGKREGKHWSTTHVRSSGSSGRQQKGGPESVGRARVIASGGSAEHTTTTETFSESTSSSSTLTGGGIFESEGNLVFGGHDYICDCSGCVQHIYELTDEDLTSVEISVITTDVHVQNCGIQLTKLSNENNLIISMLKKEKISIESDLETCRGKYVLINNDFVKIVKEVTNIKRTLQDTLDNSSKLKTQWIAATADAQKCKTKSDNLEIDLRRALEANGLLTITVNEYSTTIANLRLTVSETTTKNNQCGNEWNEWKRKYEAESAKVMKNEKRIKELEATNDDLTSRITKLTNDLSGCRNVNKQNDNEISKLRDTVTDLTKQSSKCTVDLGSCNIVLKQVTDDFNADKLQDVEAAKLRSKIELQLSECLNRKKVLEQTIETERIAVDKCKGDIVATRNDCSKRYQKYEEDIAELKSNNKISIDRCEASLKTERDSSANSRSEIIILKNRITDLDTKLSGSIKNVEDWRKQSKFCEDESINLRQKVETLQTNVADVNKLLSKCVTNGNSLQSDLTLCQSKRDICIGDLEGTRKKLTNSELQVGSLETANKNCQTELSTLRCDSDQYLKNTKSGQDKAYDALLQVLNILDSNKKLLGNFASSHNTVCRV